MDPMRVRRINVAVLAATGPLLLASVVALSPPSLAGSETSGVGGARSAQAAHAAHAAQARPRCLGRAATIVGTGAADTLRGTRHSDVIVGGGGADTIAGGGGEDWICGGGGDDQIVGGSGRGHLSGGPGSDIILGGKGVDDLRGNGGFDGMLGKAGDDRYAGGAGFDIVAFLASPDGISADLAAGRATGEGADVLSGVESVMGSPQADTIRGTDGIDLLFSGTGADVLDGRGGDNDYVLFTNAPGDVEVDLGDDSYTGGGLAPRIENVVGSPYDDTIYGDSTLNYLDGGGGDDAVDGINGVDPCQAEALVNCIPDETTTAEPDPQAPTPLLPGAGGQESPARMPTTLPHRPSADSPAQRAEHASDTSPEAVLTRTLRALRPVGRRVGPVSGRPGAPVGAPAAPAAAARSNAAGDLICPLYESLSRLTINISGLVRAATANDLDPVWRWTDYIYLSGNSYWFYNSATGAWRGPYNRIEPWGVQNYQVTGPVYTGINAYAQLYSYTTGQYYSVASCVGSVGVLGGGM